MIWALWIITGLLALLSVLIVVGNPLAGFSAWRRGKSYSFVPLIGGLSGFIACWTCPWTPVRSWSWVPLILDLSIPMAIYVFLIYMPWKYLEEVRLHDSAANNSPTHDDPESQEIEEVGQ